jgi:hypothetical protein
MKWITARRILALAVVLTTTSGTSPTAEQWLDISGHHVRIRHAKLRLTTCLAIYRLTEIAKTTIQFEGHTGNERISPDGSVTGSVLVTAGPIVIDLPDYTWPGKTEHQRLNLARMLRAAFHHEVGHVLVAIETMRSESGQGIAASSRKAYRAAAKRALADALDRAGSEQAAYDRRSRHGRNQRGLGTPLRGPNIEMSCRP